MSIPMSANLLLTRRGVESVGSNASKKGLANHSNGVMAKNVTCVVSAENMGECRIGIIGENRRRWRRWHAVDWFWYLRLFLLGCVVMCCAVLPLWRSRDDSILLVSSGDSNGISPGSPWGRKKEPTRSSASKYFSLSSSWQLFQLLVILFTKVHVGSWYINYSDMDKIIQK